MRFMRSPILRTVKHDSFGEYLRRDPKYNDVALEHMRENLEWEHLHFQSWLCFDLLKRSGWEEYVATPKDWSGAVECFKVVMELRQSSFTREYFQIVRNCFSWLLRVVTESTRPIREFRCALPRPQNSTAPPDPPLCECTSVETAARRRTCEVCLRCTFRGQVQATVKYRHTSDLVN